MTSRRRMEKLRDLVVDSEPEQKTEFDGDGRPSVSSSIDGNSDDDLLLLKLYREHPEKAPTR